MNDEELIKAALQLKKEEDEELAKLLEKAGFLFVPILLKYILQTEDKMDDTLQIDYEEVWEKVQKFLEKRTKRPTKLSIKVMLRGRSIIVFRLDAFNIHTSDSLPLLDVIACFNS